MGWDVPTVPFPDRWRSGWRGNWNAQPAGSGSGGLMAFDPVVMPPQSVPPQLHTGTPSFTPALRIAGVELLGSRIPAMSRINRI